MWLKRENRPVKRFARETIYPNRDTDLIIDPANFIELEGSMENMSRYNIVINYLLLFSSGVG